MSIVTRIKEKIEEYPNLTIDEEQCSISVTPVGGFTVWATDNGSSYTVGFEGWHEEFESTEEALICFVWGLSTECRLEVTKRGNVTHKWVAQNLENGQWVNTSTTGLLFFPFWRGAKVSHKQNAIINS